MLSAAPATTVDQIVNTVTSRDQSSPSVVNDASGNFLVIWEDQVSGANSDVVYRRFSANGTPIDGSQTGLATTTDSEEDPDISLGSGGYFAVWTQSTSGDKNILFQRLNTSGVPQGTAATVNTTGVGTTNETNAKVASNSIGQTIIVWEHADPTSNGDVYFRRYNAVGGALDISDRPAASTTRNEVDPEVTINSAGTAVIVWTETDAASDQDVFFSIINAGGSVILGRKQLNELDGGKNQKQPVVTALPNGNFAIAYTHSEAGGNDDIYLRVIDGGGNFIGADVPVITSAHNENHATIGSNEADGAIVVAYADTTAGDIGFRQFSADGTGRGVPRGIIAEGLQGGTGPLSEPSAFMNANGEFSLVYTEDLLNQNVRALNFRAPSATPGLFNPTAGQYFLRNSNNTGVADAAFFFGPPASGFLPISGDWDGDGFFTTGLYDRATGFFLLTNTNGTGFADASFVFGPAGDNWEPVAGDWDGDGRWTVGLYDPDASNFFLRNTNNTGNADLLFTFGLPAGGWKPIAGDWNGDGIVSAGLYNPTGGTFFLRNALTAGFADATFQYGPTNSALLPLAGDWDRDSVYTVGLYRQSDGFFLLRNANSTGFANVTFQFGPGGQLWLPVVGDWNAPGGTPLVAAGPAQTGLGVGLLTQSELNNTVKAAAMRWSATGLAPAQIAKLVNTQFIVADLPDNRLGMTQGGTVYIDQDAAGYGWFVDSTPLVNQEFARDAATGNWLAVQPGTASATRMDLLTAVLHEFGHVLGENHSDSLGSIMADELPVGTRRLPNHGWVDRVLSRWDQVFWRR